MREVVGHLPFFALRVLSQPARHEIDLLLKPRGVWIQEFQVFPINVWVDLPLRLSF